MKKSHYLRPDTFIVKVEAQAMLAGSGEPTIVTPASEGVQGYGFYGETFKDASTAFGDGNSLWTTDDNSDYDFTNF